MELIWHRQWTNKLVGVVRNNSKFYKQMDQKEVFTENNSHLDLFQEVHNSKWIPQLAQIAKTFPIIHYDLEDNMLVIKLILQLVINNRLAIQLNNNHHKECLHVKWQIWVEGETNLLIKGRFITNVLYRIILE